MEPNSRHLDFSGLDSLPLPLIGSPSPSAQSGTHWSEGLWVESPFEGPNLPGPAKAPDQADELLWGGTRRFGDVELVDPDGDSDRTEDGGDGDNGLDPLDPAPPSEVSPETEPWNIPSDYLTNLFAVAESASPRVLYLEDDTHHASAVRRVLTAAGYRVNCCPDANWLLPTARSFDPDLVIIDIPRQDATTIDLLRCLWAAVRSATVPIVLMSREPVDAEEIRDCWLGLDVIERPSEPSLLVPILARRLDRARAINQMFSSAR